MILILDSVSCNDIWYVEMNCECCVSYEVGYGFSVDKVYDSIGYYLCGFIRFSILYWK